MKEWIYLLIAGIMEIIWAIGLKFTNGFTKFIPTALTVTAMIFSIFFVSLSLKTLPLGTAYAVWTGIGAAGTFIVGMLFFNEPKDLMRIICVMLIIIGVIGLKFSHNDGH
jgi:quaternary ammonium compound-resistance protein SugE